MTELTLPAPAHRERYSPQRRSPRAFAAALAFNGGVFALILALPAVSYIATREPGLVIHDVPITSDPPPVREKVEPRKNPIQSDRPVEQPKDEVLPFVNQDSLFKTGPEIIGTTDPEPAVLRTQDPPFTPPVHTPVFRAASQDPRYADAFHPAYPPALQREGLEGSVTVRVTIDAKGRVIACEMVKATNLLFFEETKEQALRRWRFRPATSDGEPVQSQQTLTVHFQLEA